MKWLMNRTARKRAWAAVLALGLVAAVSGCGGGSDGGSGDLTKVTVTTNWVPSAQHAPLYVALNQGLFKKHGLDVKVEPGKGSLDAALKVGAGSAQFALIDTTAALVAIGKGAEVVNVAAYMKKYPGGICFNERKVKINSLEDFKGATLGTVENDAFTLGLKSLLKRNGIDAASAIKEVITDAATQQSALLAGRVDMIPCSTQSKMGAIRGGKAAGVDVGFFSLADHGLDAVGFSLVVARSVIDKDEKTVAGFVAAFTEATQLTIDDPKAAVAGLKANVPDVTERTELDLLVDEVIPCIIKDEATRYTFTDDDIAATVRNAEDSFGVTLSDPSRYFTNKYVEVH
ncbi:ABC transporter substrate-binding protein [Micromonospora sp. NPDC048830]|uniref:ABC transporter substrate-binding protein n=1 Tax=Micromonospora sp. NPDC048830 TaxID=3364257 RepID=UPI00372258CE